MEGTEGKEEKEIRELVAAVTDFVCGLFLLGRPIVEPDVDRHR